MKLRERLGWVAGKDRYGDETGVFHLLVVLSTGRAAKAVAALEGLILGFVVSINIREALARAGALATEVKRLRQLRGDA